MATTFIIIVCLIILICITLAVIVGIFMHVNSGLNNGEPEPAGAMLDDNAQMHSITGPLPPFLLNPTQPLSEIYYHEEQNLIPQPEPLQAEPTEPMPPHMPQGPQPTGPLPIYHHNQ